MVGQIKVWREAAGDIALIVPLDGEGTRLILPSEVVEVEYARELFFRFVRKADGRLIARLRFVLVAEAFLEHGHRPLEFGQQCRRDFDGLLRWRNRPGGMLLFYYYELVAFAPGDLYRDLGVSTDAEATHLI